MDGERAAIARSVDGPVTPSDIVKGLGRLGVQPGDALLVHASLTAFGFVLGAASTVVAALKQAVGPDGLVVMPAFTGHLSDPAEWRDPPVPESWWGAIRRETPAFDAATTPVRGVGAIAEALRTSAGACRGPHPQLSFTAWGKGAAEAVAPHDLGQDLGEGSPLSRLYERDAKVVFLGTGYQNCTAFHLAEHRSGRLSWRPNGAPLTIGGRRQWVEFEAPAYDMEPFADLGRDFEAQAAVATARIGAAACRLFPMREAVDFAQGWLRERPGR